MKTTDRFKEVLKAHLDKRAQEDNLFAASYAKEGKNIDDCCIYILNQVKASGCNGFPDDEIFGMAIHYYNEDNIEVGNPIKCQVVVNRSIELTDAEKEEARKDAIKKYQDEQMAKLNERSVKPKKKAETVVSPSLFD